MYKYAQFVNREMSILFYISQDLYYDAKIVYTLSDETLDFSIICFVIFIKTRFMYINAQYVNMLMPMCFMFVKIL